MFQNLTIFRTAQALAVHAGQRQALLARNIANVDTPGYVARDLSAFSTSKLNNSAQVMKTTRAGHLSSGSSSGHSYATLSETELSPNGNGVSVEAEMLKAVEVQRQHVRAIAIYKSSLKILRTSVRGQ